MKVSLPIALSAACATFTLSALFVLHEWNLSKIKPVEIQIYAHYPCTPNRYGSPQETACAMYMAEEPISLFRVDPPLLFGAKGPILASHVLLDKGAWKAEAAPGRYRIDVMVSGHFILKSLTAGDTDLLKPDGLYIVPETGTADVIHIDFVPASAVEGSTTKDGHPVAARVFALNENTYKSVMSVSGNAKNSAAPFTYRLYDLAAGVYRFCAIENADLNAAKIDAYDSLAVQNWCRKVKLVTMNDAQQMRLDLETVRAE